MLTPLQPIPAAPPAVPIAEAAFPAPFPGTLEYNPPARGPWNIVHTGMLLPDSHQIYCCAQGCLRGVLLTAAEMQEMGRMSWITVDEHDLYNGSLEQHCIDGAAAILRRLPRRPRAVLLYISCLHLFTGFDFPHVLAELAKRFHGIDFIDCIMHPTMRKSGLTPEQLLRRQLYQPLKPLPARPNLLHILGNDLATRDDFLDQALPSVERRELALCRDYDDFLRLAEAPLILTTQPVALPAAQHLAARLGVRHLHLPVCYDTPRIQASYDAISRALAVPMRPVTDWRPRLDEAWRRLRDALGDTPVALDYTATPHPRGLAAELLRHGIRVVRLYADAFVAEEREDFRWLQDNAPTLEIRSCVHPAMADARPAAPNRRIFAIGQKAAWYENAPRFANLYANLGLYGFGGLLRLLQLLHDSTLLDQDTPAVIRHKGLTCHSCL